jgi:hypothetical protein
MAEFGLHFASVMLPMSRCIVYLVVGDEEDAERIFIAASAERSQGSKVRLP